MKILQIVKSATGTVFLLGFSFVALTALLWTAASSDKIYTYLGDKYATYQNEKDNQWLNGELEHFDSRAVSTISLNSVGKVPSKKETQRAEEKKTQELLVNEIKSSLEYVLSKDNLHNHMKKARLIVTSQPKNYAMNTSCKKTSINDLLRETSLVGEHYIESLKSKRRLTDSYKEVQENVFNAMMSESCRIYKGRYTENQIALISVMATNTLIQAETL